MLGFSYNALLLLFNFQGTLFFTDNLQNVAGPSNQSANMAEPVAPIIPPPAAPAQEAPASPMLTSTSELAIPNARLPHAETAAPLTVITTGLGMAKALTSGVTQGGRGNLDVLMNGTDGYFSKGDRLSDA